MKNAHIGFSVNPELRFNFFPTPGFEKGDLLDFQVGLAGAGANITIALQSLEEDARLLGFVGPDNSDRHGLLDMALNRQRITHKLIEVLDRTNIAVIPVDEGSKGSSKVYGARGTVDPSKVEKVLFQLRTTIAIEQDDFVVTSGIMEGELPFAKVLLQKATRGYRMFGPKRNLCGTEAFRKFLPNCDLLILNEIEWQDCNMTYDEAHSLGPRLVVVTCDEKGCDYSFQGIKGHVNAFFVPDVPHFKTGAGDWFFGGFLKAMIARELSIETLSVSHLKECLGFAAKVAGLKVTKPGSSFGPTLAEVMLA